MTLRLTRAILWLQWRLFVNGLKGGRSRDGMERVSRFGEVAVYGLTAALLVPLMLGMAALGAFSGWALAATREGADGVPTATMVVLLIPTLWFLVRPLIVATYGSRPERGALLRLLPIPRPMLGGLEAIRAAFDPFFLLFAPAVALLPVGVGIGGRPGLALMVAVAGLALLVLFLGLAAGAALAVQLVLRDRRRAELASLLIVLVLSFAGLLPQLLGGNRTAAHAGDTHRSVTSPRAAPRRVGENAPGAHDGPPPFFRAFPSTAYAQVLGHGAREEWRPAAADLGVLLLLAVGAYAASIPLHRRLVETPESFGRPRTASRRGAAIVRIPGFTPAACAVATAQVRTVLRSVRGKMVLIGAPLTTLVFAVAFSRHPQTTPAFLANPVGLALMAVFIAVSNLSAVTLNQFAVEGKGLVLQFLAPISERDLVSGKALGSAALLVVPLACALVPIPILLPRVDLSLLVCAFLAGLAAQTLASPVAATLSAFFPRTADLGKLSRANQPHGLASLVGFPAQLVALGPSVALTLLAWRVIGMPILAPVLVAAWLAVAVMLARLLWPFAARAVRARRENLALVAVGR